MVQALAITDALKSLAEVNATFGLAETAEPQFFQEWFTDLPGLTETDQQRLDQIKRRYLYHRQYGHLLENAVNFLVISPLLELAGFYDPPFRLEFSRKEGGRPAQRASHPLFWRFPLRSEVSVKIELEDDDGSVYQGRIDALVVTPDLWVILVESKRTSFNMTLALPQALAYMATQKSEKPMFSLVSNGEYSMFIKLLGSQYAFSDDFSLNRRHNELYQVLQILNQLK